MKNLVFEKYISWRIFKYASTWMLNILGTLSIYLNQSNLYRFSMTNVTISISETSMKIS